MKNHIEQYGFGFWAVEERISGRFIGFIGLQWTNFEADFTPCVEIGWRLDKRYWRKGYATEGARACLDHAFHQSNLEEVYSFSARVNEPSEGVMKKIGMQKIGEFEHPNVHSRSKLASHVLYRTAVDNWLASQSS
jgi:ribosomal-protein-alanine N-acetyltransferase